MILHLELFNIISTAYVMFCDLSSDLYFTLCLQVSRIFKTQSYPSNHMGSSYLHCNKLLYNICWYDVPIYKFQNTRILPLGYKSSMRQYIEPVLDQFHRRRTNVGVNFSEIAIKRHTFSLHKMWLYISVTSDHDCWGPSVLITWQLVEHLPLVAFLLIWFNLSITYPFLNVNGATV